MLECVVDMLMVSEGGAMLGIWMVWKVAYGTIVRRWLRIVLAVKGNANVNSVLLRSSDEFDNCIIRVRARHDLKVVFDARVCCRW